MYKSSEQILFSLCKWCVATN